MTSASTDRGHVLIVRPDSMGDVVVSGPAVRAVAATAERVTFLAGPRGHEAARLLPGIDSVVVAELPWILRPAPEFDRAALGAVIDRLQRLDADEALVLTSYHQSALPTALCLRLAGVPRIAAVSEDYPGSLLDVRLPEPGDAAESERMLDVAAGAGFRLPAGDDGLPALRSLDGVDAPCVPGPYVVVHPGADAQARRYPAEHWAQVIGRLAANGHTVVLTGAAAERELIDAVMGMADGPGPVIDLSGRLDLAQLAAVLAGAAVVAVGNTGPAHLAAAVRTPVVSLFAPVVPAQRWRPVGAPTVLLGDQHAACAGTRAVTCPVPGHPCLAGVAPADVVAAMQEFTSAPHPVALSAAATP